MSDNALTNHVQLLLTLPTPEERQAGIRRHFPCRDDELIAQLRQESHRRERSNPHQALSIAHLLIDAAAVWRDPEVEAIALIIQANAYRLLAKHESALRCYQQSISIYQSLGMEFEAARAGVGQLEPLMYLGRYEEANKLADLAIAQFRSVGEQTALGKTLLNQGNILARLSRFEEALGYYEEAHEIFRTLDDAEFVAMLDVNRANVLEELNDFRQAEQLYGQARTYFDTADMTSAVAQIDHNLACLYLSQGEYQRSLSIFNRARTKFAAVEGEIDIAYVDLYRSNIYLALNLWQEALEMIAQARPAFEQANMRKELALLWINEAAALAHFSNGMAAQDALDAAREMFVEEQNRAGEALIDLYQATFDLSHKQLRRAQASAEKAREVFSEIGLRSRAAQCEVILGDVALQQKQTAAAAHHFTEALALLAGAELPSITYLCHYGLGRVHQELGQTYVALSHYRHAVAVVEQLWGSIGAEDYKISFRRDKLQVYENLLMLCLEANTPHVENEVFEVLEKMKSRALLDALGHETFPHSEEASRELVHQLGQIKRELNWYYDRLYTFEHEDEAVSAPQIDQLTAEVSRREKEMSQLLTAWQSPELAALPDNPTHVVSPEQLREVLPADTLLLNFYMSHDRLIVMGLTATSSWIERVPISWDAVTHTLGQFYFQINKYQYGAAYRQRHAKTLLRSVQDALHKLYTVLIQPIEARLTADTLLVVPHGVLHGVPFHALFDGTRYLIEERAISYAPSATLLYHSLRQSAPIRPASPLILGLSDTGIPHAEDEAAAIAQLFPGAKLHLGEGATLEHLYTQAEPPPFLHLATHATFRSDNPLFSAIKLADGWLSVNDINGLRPTAPLVTLSACETGRNQVGIGDELMGLCRGFFRAGSRALVASLWAAEDETTTQLMAQFYGALQGEQPVYQALRNAQIAVMAEQRHPYYWAPFMLTGNPWMCFSELATT